MEDPKQEGIVEESETIGEEKPKTIGEESMEGLSFGDFPEIPVDDDSEEPSEESDDSEDLEDDQDDSADDLEPDGEDADESDEEDELDKLINPKKDSVQKRIDKLTAKIKALEEKNEVLKEGKTEEEPETKYTDQQLNKALQKAFDDGDSSLAMEIVKYIAKSEGDKRVSKYEKEMKSQQERVIANQREWTTLVNENKEFSDPKSPELFTGSRADLNLAVPNSLLNRLAYQLYSSADSANRYQMQGGQRLAVADAFKVILKSKRQKGSNKEVKLLNKKLSREKRKHSLSSSKVKKQDKGPSKSLSEKEKLSEYLAERKKPLFSSK